VHRDYESKQALLEDAASRPLGDQVHLPIREFIGYWKAKRRGSWVVDQIRHDLDVHGLVTVPSFEHGWIDNTIVLKCVAGPPLPDQPEAEDATQLWEAPAAWRFRDLPSAASGLVTVPRDATIQRAQSLMVQHDFSQLVVANGPRNIVGVVSWESIGRARMHRPDVTLQGATVRPVVVMIDEEVLPRVPDITLRGYVVVRDVDQTLCGIVTTTDISEQFRELAGPFLLVGEIERRLRRLVSAHHDLPQLQAARHPGDDQRVVTSVADLTMGEYIQLLDQEGAWSRIGWDVERRVFIETLHDFRELRNEVMHFSPDPLDPARLMRAQNLLEWLRLAVPE
jgi:CBS domain-containing protein